MPERSIKVNPNDRPWMTSHSKRLILQRRKALALGNNFMFKLLRNKVNREKNVVVKYIIRKKLATYWIRNLKTGGER
jgi:hypothetical protein